MRTGARPGIAALLARANVNPATVDLETVGFVLAPRLNAAGRVGEALDAARLLLASTPEEAAELAKTLESANTTRRDLMRTAIAEARAALGLGEPGQAPGQLALDAAGSERATPAPITVAGGPGHGAILVHGPWPIGIIGLVAGRLADETGLPTIVATDAGPVLRASCRGDGRLNLAAALDACDDLLVRHGGHAAAAGFELPADRWDAFTERFLALAAGSRPEDPRTALAVLGLTVQRVRAANGGHTQLVLRRDVDVLDGIAFGRADLATTVAEGDVVDVVARLASRSFGGLETLQLEVRDVATSGSHPRAAAVLAGVAERVAARETAIAAEPLILGGRA